MVITHTPYPTYNEAVTALTGQGYRKGHNFGGMELWTRAAHTCTATVYSDRPVDGLSPHAPVRVKYINQEG